jgi:hypothetical protein
MINGQNKTLQIESKQFKNNTFTSHLQEVNAVHDIYASDVKTSKITENRGRPFFSIELYLKQVQNAIKLENSFSLLNQLYQGVKYE